MFTDDTALSTAGRAGQSWPFLTALAALTALTACSHGPDEPAAAPAPASLSLTGTAATGAAIAGRSVDAKCQAGTGTATTGSDGSFTISVTNGSLPCVLRVTLADGSVLHSVAVGSGTTQRANLTPLSELLLARLTAGIPAAYYASFDATAAAALTAVKVDAARAAVEDTMAAAGVDLSAAGNLLTGALVAANGSTAGNVLDQKLDALKARLTSSGTTLAALSATVALSSPQAPATAPSGTVSLPAAQLLQPAAANCAALRSGRYRVIDVLPNNTQVASRVVTLDAVNFTVNDGTGVQALPFVANGTCRYGQPSGEEVVVSQAGIFVVRARDTTVSPYNLKLAFPEQNHALADLAGEWNRLGYDAVGNTVTTGTTSSLSKLDSATLTIDANGAVTAGSYCADMRNCVAVPSTLRFSANASGGFDFRNTADTWVDRVFMFRSGGGEPMLVQVASNGSVKIGTRKRVSAAPVVSGTASQGWNVGLDASGRPSFAISDYSNTVTSVDSTAGTFLRSNVFNFSTGATVPETLALNTPRDGFGNRRAATGVTASDGTVRNVSEFISLSLRGTGISAVALPANGSFNLSVAKP